jgi:hypothetical protein
MLLLGREWLRKRFSPSHERVRETYGFPMAAWIKRSEREYFGVTYTQRPAAYTCSGFINLKEILFFLKVYYLFFFYTLVRPIYSLLLFRVNRRREKKKPDCPCILECPSITQASIIQPGPLSFIYESADLIYMYYTMGPGTLWKFPSAFRQQQLTFELFIQGSRLRIYIAGISSHPPGRSRWPTHTFDVLHRTFPMTSDIQH